MGELAEFVARARARDGSPGRREVMRDARTREAGGELISPFAMDIVDNCNLRCPFCVYDYSKTHRTNTMSDAVFEAALRFAPYASEGNFWLSCLHEASLHPRFASLIERIPRAVRRKVMFTTNLAKPMPRDYFDLLARSGLHHVNISLESLDPAIYERMRKGARFRVFMQNWEQLLDAVRTGPAPPRLRYNLIAYRSNLDEMPGLVDQLLAERGAAQVEIREVFPERHIPKSFLDAERIDDEDWRRLRARLAHVPAEQLVYLTPNTDAANAAAPAQLLGPPRPFKIRVEWTGSLVIYEEAPGPGGLPIHTQFVMTNVLHITDVASFLAAF